MIGKKSYNICLVGAGRMGRRWAGIIAQNKGAKLALVVDVNKTAGARCAREFRAVYAPEWSRRTLDQYGIDAVFVVTPHIYLYPNARAALAAGRHVFVEKPGSRNAAEMRALIQLSQKYKSVLMVGFNYRHFDAISRAYKITKSGRIGAVLFVRMRHGHPGRRGYEKEWRMKKNQAGGGELMDQGVHLLDLAHWLVPGKLVPAGAALSNGLYKANVEDNAFVLLKNREGQIASIQVGVSEWKPIFKMEIYGSKGYCLVDGVGRKYGGGETLTIGIRQTNGKISEHTIICNPEADNCLRLELKQFISAVRRGRPAISGGREALRILEIIKKIYGRGL